MHWWRERFHLSIKDVFFDFICHLHTLFDNMILLKILRESFRMAAGQLWGNKLRSFLSLLGISIGIFCIIAVMSAVDSLEKTILDGFSEFGSDVVYIDKQPWTEDPGDNYWKYLKRPEPSLADYESIKKRSKLTDIVSYCYFTGAGSVKHKENSVDGAFVMGSTPEYIDLQGMELQEGRFFTSYEFQNATNVVIIGDVIKKEIFGDKEAVGKEIKMLGQKWQVIGILKEEGENPFNFLNFDEVIWMGLNSARKFFIIGRPRGNTPGGQLLAAKVKEGHTLAELKDELTGIIRGNRRIRPFESENFALNEVSMLADVIGEVFGAINIAGFIIGIFALIVGMISVANIMFVSVKERTGMIGVKKALGAKRAFILLEFLIEAIFLCLVGGAMGLFFVFALLKIVSALIPFEMAMSMNNVIIGVSVSVVVGVLAGVIPAAQASKLDPVDAMRG
ncbi:MAG: putative ABC transport system permease protein [Saprospiraceae bacterium]|jgi:putative ABC transport system permease protein